MSFRTLTDSVWLVVLLVGASAYGIGDERYYGGSYDGYSEGLFLQSGLTEYGSRFSGGSYDGYDEGVFFQSDHVRLAARFAGGPFDGSDDALLLQSDPQRLVSRYRGGSYDGYDDGIATNQFNALNLDSDEDGLTDWWEAEYFNSLAMLNADGDYDLDGDSDTAEFIALTDPVDSNAFFRVFSIAGTHAVAVMFPSSPLRVYSLHSSTSLIFSRWSAVEGQTNVSGDAAGVMHLLDTNGSVWRAYRVNVQQP